MTAPISKRGPQLGPDERMMDKYIPSSVALKSDLLVPRALSSFVPGERYSVERTTADPNPARPALPLGVGVEWIDKVESLAAPTNWIDGDRWWKLPTAAAPTATVIYTASAEGIAHGTTLNATVAPEFSNFNVGGGTNTQKASTTTPLVGSVSYEIFQATGGAICTVGADSTDLGIGSPITNWSIEMWFRYVGALPALTGGSALLRVYFDDTYAGASQSATMFVTSTGRVMVYSSANLALDSQSTYLISADTSYRMRIEGNSVANTIAACLDTGGAAAPLWQANTVPASGNEVKAMSSFRWGFGTASSNTTVRAEFKVGTGPGYIAPNYVP